MLGYIEDVGIDDENRHDPKEYRDDFYKGQTDSFVGTRSPFTTRITITGPADFTINSVGTKTADTVNGWPPDRRLGERSPGEFFQRDRGAVAGRARRGNGHLLSTPPIPTTSPRCARASTPPARYYSQWFFEYPWRELKLSEFPNLATYAQGFPDQHHILRRDRLLDREQPGDSRRLRDHRSRVRPPVVGQYPDAGQGARRQHPRGGHRPLLDDPARRTGQGTQRPDRFLQAPGGELRPRPSGRFRAAAGQDHRRTTRRYDGDLRQGGLGVLDAPQPDGARASAGRHAERLSRLITATPTTRCCKTSWPQCVPFAADTVGLRRIHSSVVFRGRRPRISSSRTRKRPRKGRTGK